MHMPRVPFKILAFGPFSASQSGIWGRAPIPVDYAAPDRAMAEMDLTCHVSVPKNICTTGTITIRPTSMKHFHPDHLAAASTYFSELKEARHVTDTVGKRGGSPDQLQERFRNLTMLPPRVGAPGEPKKAPSKKTPNGLDDLLNMVALPEQEGPSVREERGSDHLTALTREALEQVYSDPDFRRNEAVWHGVRCLTAQCEDRANIFLELVPTRVETLEDTLNAVASQLGDELPSLAVVDLPFDNSPFCIDLLGKVAAFSERMLMPTVCWITHRFLHLEGWDGLENLAHLPHHITGQAYAKWHRFVESAAARWMTVTCNPILARPPFGPGNMPRIAPFQEDGPLWMSPVWCIAGLIAKSMAKTGWPTRFTSWKQIRIEDLPVAVSEKGKAYTTLAEISEDRFQQFLSSGITPVIVPKNADYAVVPDETTAGGGSLAYQCLLSRTIQVLMAIEAQIEAATTSDEITTLLKDRFSLFWEHTGFPPPEDLLVSSQGNAPDGRAVVAISFTPPPEVLPSSQEIKLELLWGSGNDG